mmetsp:Transcript_69656/g.213560  ORF Transcript_69656/g.213560 Transcript_69656/m.213560 type:complete len:219 (-) Transcript_69656:15-671(-)
MPADARWPSSGRRGGRTRQNTRIEPRSSWTTFCSARTSPRRVLLSCSSEATAISFCSNNFSKRTTRSIAASPSRLRRRSSSSAAAAPRGGTASSSHRTQSWPSEMSFDTCSYKVGNCESSSACSTGLSAASPSSAISVCTSGWTDCSAWDLETSAAPGRSPAAPRRSSTSRKLASQRLHLAADSKAFLSLCREAYSLVCAWAATFCKFSRSWSSTNHL